MGYPGRRQPQRQSRSVVPPQRRQGLEGGDAIRPVTVKTRAEPMPAAGGHVYHVYPRDWKGAREPGSFNDLMCAYNYYCGGGDTVTASRPRVKAGDIIL